MENDELEATIEQRVSSLVKSMQSPARSSLYNESTHMRGTGTRAGADEASSGRGQLAVSFTERRRRKTYFFGKAEEEVCWETWVLDVTCATPRTDAGELTA